MKIAFIGTGNMGGALAKAVRRAEPQAEILLADHDIKKAEDLANLLNAKTVDNQTAVAEADYLFLGVKPQMLESLAESIGVMTAKRENLTLISMAAGVKIEKIEALFGANRSVIRIMPNTPVSVGEGMVLWCANEKVTEKQKTDFAELFSKAGKIRNLPEHLIDAGCALSGCGPAFVCLFVEALADGGVACGLARNDAMELAMQTLVGTAKLMQESGQHPAEMKDAVCSPAGSTIAGVATLEKGAFRGTVMDAVAKAFEKTQKLGK